MEAAPHKMIEAVIGFLIPPACREEVLGDLHERYRSPSQYIAEALCVIPLVILSRIRRTTDSQMLLMEAFVLYGSFLAASWIFQAPSFLYEQDGLLRLAIPTLVAMLVLVLEDAYATPKNRAPLRPLKDTALGIGFAFLSQAALSSDWALPRLIMVSGACASLLLISALRFLFPPNDNRPRGAT